MLLQNTERRSLRCTLGPCWLSVLMSISAYILIPTSSLIMRFSTRAPESWLGKWVYSRTLPGWVGQCFLHPLSNGPIQNPGHISGCPLKPETHHVAKRAQHQPHQGVLALNQAQDRNWEASSRKAPSVRSPPHTCREGSPGWPPDSGSRSSTSGRPLCARLSTRPSTTSLL